MVYNIWVEAEGYANAEFQTVAETAKTRDREVKDLRAMDCGKIVVSEHATIGDAELFVDYMDNYVRPIKVKTGFSKFQYLNR